MRNVLIVSHGTMAEGVYKAAKMIYGELENVRYLCLQENMGVEGFKENLKEIVKDIKHSDEIITLADLKGGSPYTAAISVLSEMGLLSKSVIISGLNLPMLLTVMFTEDELKNGKEEEIINAAKDGIGKFQVENNNDMDDEL